MPAEAGIISTMFFQKRVLIAALAVVSLALSWVSLGVPANQPAQASTTDLLSCRFSPAQVFDVQYYFSPSRDTLYISDITRPWASTGPLSEADLDDDDYFKFANSTREDAVPSSDDPSLAFVQYSSAHAEKRTMHTYGDFEAFGEDFIFYLGSDRNGTVITTGEGFDYGASASLAVSNGNPTLEQVLAYTSCSATPLAAGFRRDGSGPPPEDPEPEDPAPEDPEAEGDTSAESETSVVNEPAIGLDLRAVVGGRTSGAKLDIIGLSLPAGTTYSLSVSSPARTLVSGAVGGNGTFQGLIPVPQDLGEGTHIAVLRATLPSGEVLELHRDFTIGSDGSFTSVGQSTVGPAVPAVVDPRLAYTGVQSSVLPWWALTSLSLGLALVLYSVRARRIVELAEATAAGLVSRTPWEILSTPIRVPGIDYVPGSAAHSGSVSLAEAMKELDLAFSRMIVSRIDSLQAHFSVR
jgi:hypothetical protein